MKTDPPQKGPRIPPVTSENSTPSETEKSTAHVAALDNVETVRNPHSSQHAQAQRPAPESPKHGTRPHHRETGETENMRTTPRLERLPSDLPVAVVPPPGTKDVEESGTLKSHLLETISVSSGDEGLEEASASDDDTQDLGVLYTPLNIYIDDGVAPEAESTSNLTGQDDVPSLANHLIDPAYRVQHGLEPLDAVPETAAASAPSISHLMVPIGHDRATGMPPRTKTQFREIKPSISLATEGIKLGPSIVDDLGMQFTKAGQKWAFFKLENPLLVQKFYGADCAVREKLMNVMSTVKVGIRFKDNSVPSNFWRRIKHKVAGAFKPDKLAVRGDVAFMLRMSHNAERGRAFGAAVSAARPEAIDDMLAITKTSRFLTSGILLDATLEIAEVVARDDPSHASASLNAAGDIICAYISAADADKTISRDGKLLADVINTVAGAKTSDLRLRGTLVGLYIAGAYKFSMAATKRDEESIKRYKAFNNVLWDSLNAVTFPGVAAVTAVLKASSEALIDYAFVPRDFRAQLITRLGAIKYAIEKGHEKTIKPADIIIGKDFLNGKVMDWIDITLNCNGIL